MNRYLQTHNRRRRRRRQHRSVFLTKWKISLFYVTSCWPRWIVVPRTMRKTNTYRNRQYSCSDPSQIFRQRSLVTAISHRFSHLLIQSNQSIHSNQIQFVRNLTWLYPNWIKTNKMILILTISTQMAIRCCPKRIWLNWTKHRPVSLIVIKAKRKYSRRHQRIRSVSWNWPVAISMDECIALDASSTNYRDHVSSVDALKLASRVRH